jgi:hypothetical protein
MKNDMYESENDNKPVMAETSFTTYGKTCRVPPSNFRIRFEPVNRFDTGIQIGITVDGILCLSYEDAEKVFKTRMYEIMEQWNGYIAKV